MVRLCCTLSLNSHLHVLGITDTSCSIADVSGCRVLAYQVRSYLMRSEDTRNLRRKQMRRVDHHSDLPISRRCCTRRDKRHRVVVRKRLDKYRRHPSVFSTRLSTQTTTVRYLSVLSTSCEPPLCRLESCRLGQTSAQSRVCRTRQASVLVACVDW